MRKTLITFAFVALAIVSRGQDRTLFDFNMRAAYDALGTSDYTRALKFFMEAQKSPVLKQKNELGLKMLVDELVILTQKRKDLGVIQPSVRHKAMVLWVEHVDAEYENSSGNMVTIKKDLTEDDKKAGRNRLPVMREIYEALSDGNFTIDFDEVSITEPLKYVELKDGQPWPTWGYYDGAAEIIRANFDTHDTFIWATNMIQGEAHGGQSRFPLGQGLLSPHKGFIELNPVFTHNLWNHEFFHVVESMAGISPMHGQHADTKHHFPGWTGEGGNELNYYAWQFKTTIPAKGYDKLKIKTKLADEDPGDPFENPASFKTVGSWSPKEVTNDWSVKEWKVSSEKLPAGPVKIMMLYTGGWKAIDIAWVAIWQDNKEIVMDEHFGFSGTKKRNIVYTLDVPQKLKGSFVIKAKIKGDNGTDSNGKVLMK